MLYSLLCHFFLLIVLYNLLIFPFDFLCCLILAVFHSVHSPPFFIPLPVFLPFFSVMLSDAPFRPGGPSASAGQCHAGCEWHVPADGGDREAGGAACSSGGERTLLYLHQLPAACSGTAHLNVTYMSCTAAPLNKRTWDFRFESAFNFILSLLGEIKLVLRKSLNVKDIYLVNEVYILDF